MKYLNRLNVNDRREFYNLLGFRVEDIENNRHFKTKASTNSSKNIFQVLLCPIQNSCAGPDIGEITDANKSITVVAQVNDFEILYLRRSKICHGHLSEDETINKELQKKFHKFMYKTFGEEYKKDCVEYMNKQINNDFVQSK